jgi:hypothetical protein
MPLTTNGQSFHVEKAKISGHALVTFSTDMRDAASPASTRLEKIVGASGDITTKSPDDENAAGAEYNPESIDAVEANIIIASVTTTTTLARMIRIVSPP